MNDAFVRQLVQELTTMPLPARALRQAARRNRLLTQEVVRVLGPLMASHLPKAKLCHGGDLSGWAECKEAQNVKIGGRPNTFDVFLKDDADGTTLAIEVEYARECDHRGCAVYGGAIQQGIGQAMIAAMRHTYSLCLVACEGRLPVASAGDQLGPLVTRLWDDFRVGLIVRSTSLEEAQKKRPAPSSSAPSPPKDGEVRPEDVVFEEMDPSITGIIITGTREPKPESSK